MTVAAAATLAWPFAARAQDLGHRILGTAGLDAGSPPAPGLYVLDRFASYRADAIRDRNGDPVPIEGIDIDAFGNALGLAGVVAIPDSHATLGASVALPLASVDVRSDRPEASVDRFGFGDVPVQPFQLGLQFDRGGLVASYTVYVPTGRFEFGGDGTSQGHVAHQLSFGGIALFDENARWFGSALFSYVLNQPKRGVDITRGDTVQVQGGVGVRPSPLWEFGFAGYLFFQVEDDSGQDLPAVVRGARERAFGLGPELAVRIPAIRAIARVRYETDLGVRSRPSGQIAVLGLTFAVLARERPAVPEHNGASPAPEVRPGRRTALVGPDVTSTLPPLVLDIE